MGRRPQARLKILAAASQLFWRHGYEGVGVDQICRAAGVNKGSVYHHHRDKEQLAVAVIEHNLERTREGIEEALRGKGGRARILGYLDWLIAVQSENALQQGGFCGCPFGKMSVGQSGTPIGRAVEHALGQIRDFVAAALAEFSPALTNQGRFALAEELTMIWQGALVLSEASNSVEPLKRARILTARALTALTAEQKQGTP